MSRCVALVRAFLYFAILYILYIIHLILSYFGYLLYFAIPLYFGVYYMGEYIDYVGRVYILFGGVAKAPFDLEIKSIKH